MIVLEGMSSSTAMDNAAQPSLDVA
jgi:hypothetical protein